MFKNHEQFLQFSKNLLHSIKNPQKNKSAIKSFNTLASAMAQAIPDNDFSIHSLQNYLDNQGDSLESTMKNEFIQNSKNILLNFVSTLPTIDSKSLINSFWEVHKGNYTGVYIANAYANEDVFNINLKEKTRINDRKTIALLTYNIPDMYLRNALSSKYELGTEKYNSYLHYDYIRNNFDEILDRVYEDFCEIVDYDNIEKINSQIINEIMKAIDKHNFSVQSKL